MSISYFSMFSSGTGVCLGRCIIFCLLLEAPLPDMADAMFLKPNWSIQAIQGDSYSTEWSFNGRANSADKLTKKRERSFHSIEMEAKKGGSFTRGPFIFFLIYSDLLAACLYRIHPKSLNLIPSSPT